ncbi:MAG: serine/threonine protein kinase [Planctomycetes bacterium]|nr:serine/threonine protein kinase [Planctomycetota bacterium]
MSETIHDRFKLLKKCGSGGTGEVYQARDLRLKRLVAIKRVRAAGAGRHETLQRLLQEAENLARVEHPNVVTVHDILETDTSVSIIMELVKGKPFLKLFHRRPIPESEYLVYFHQLVAAVEAVHAVGIIHRDINPRNVMVSREGVVKLTDFGLSGSVHADDLRAGGTLGYMAPEVLRTGGRPGFGVDIYSLGFMSYQALLGIPNFRKLHGSTKPRDWVRWVLSREPFQSLVELGAPVSRAFSRVVTGMLQKDPASRYRSISAVRKDLEAILEKRSSPQTAASAQRAPAGSSLLNFEEQPPPAER